METIFSHTVKYRTEKYFKNKLIKNLPTLISERKVNFNAHPNRHQALFHFSFQLSQGRAYKISKFAGTQLAFVGVRGLTVK